MAFYERQEARNAKLVEQGMADRVKTRSYTGAPTYPEQILTTSGIFRFARLCRYNAERRSSEPRI